MRQREIGTVEYWEYQSITILVRVALSPAFSLNRNRPTTAGRFLPSQPFTVEDTVAVSILNARKAAFSESRDHMAGSKGVRNGEDSKTLHVTRVQARLSSSPSSWPWTVWSFKVIMFVGSLRFVDPRATVERGVYDGVMYGLYWSRLDVRASDWRVGWESSHPLCSMYDI